MKGGLLSLTTLGLLSIVSGGSGGLSSGDVRGQHGSLHAPDGACGDGCNKNKFKIVVEFDPECTPNYGKVKNYYKALTDDLSECLYEDTHKHKQNIYEVNGTYHAYIYLKYEDCVDDVDIDYDDYCIESFDFEEELDLVVSCSSESSYVNGVYLWHTDQIDASSDSTYNYVTSGSNNIDLYILDTGVLSSHDEFTHTTVVHLDSSFGDSSIAGYHGSHVAGIAGGKTTGTFKNAYRIYEYPACRNGASCTGQDIEDALLSVISTLQSSGRRGVINMSFGGTSSSADWYESYFEQMESYGGIPVASAGNSAIPVCGSSYIYVPTGADTCISVGSYTSSGAVSSFSNYGDCVDVYGPGSSVYSATHYGDSSYTYASGTSMSGPAVAGLIANLLYVNDDLTFDEIRSIVSSSSYSKTLSSCPSGTCNGIEMTCDEIISASGGSDDSDDDDSEYFTCNDGCQIPNNGYWVNDGYYCDCSNCEDESSLTCSSCGGCPTSCGSWVTCSSSYKLSGDASCSDDTSIDSSDLNDNYCNCNDCSDESEWTCDSCANGCPSTSGGDDATYCWNSDSSQVSRASHSNDAVSASGEGVHCGCNDESYDTLVISNLYTVLHGNVEVYDFNGDWTLVSGCINGESYFQADIYNPIEEVDESFILYYTGGQWTITKELYTQGYWAGCVQSDILSCSYGNWWVSGNNGFDTDAAVSTESKDNCASTSVTSDDETSLSVSLYEEETSDDGSKTSDSNSNNDSSDDLEGWAWLLIGISICVGIAAIIGIYCCACSDYTLVKNGERGQVGMNPNYDLMKD